MHPFIGTSSPLVRWRAWLVPALALGACDPGRPDGARDRVPPGLIDPTIPQNGTFCAPVPAAQARSGSKQYFRYMSAQPITWLDAKRDCEAMGGDMLGGKLAVPVSAVESRALLDLAGERDLYLGFKQAPAGHEIAGGWTTVEGGKPPLLQWAPGEPNDYDGVENDEQNCALLARADGLWQDAPCITPQAADWVCEFPGAPTLCGEGARCSRAAGEKSYTCRCAAGQAYDDLTNRCVAGCAADLTYGDRPVCRAWRYNVARTSSHLEGALPTGVQRVDVAALGDGTPFMEVRTAGIPEYARALTGAEIDAINRDHAGDFRTADGRTSAVADFPVEFGQDIGYAAVGCRLGYWPPGAVCPSDAGLVARIPLAPAQAATRCQASHLVGVWLSGALAAGWSDDRSYQGGGVWREVAPAAERLDLDVCGGHAERTTGRYHHHAASACLAGQLGDDGASHSPIHGYAADGYPIHGPWHAAGVLARSCWRTRDYDTAGAPTGCGGGGARTCLLVDPENVALGTLSTARPGPATSATVTSASGRRYQAASGFYFEDYYFDASCAAQGGPALDEHNGHDHDGLGYHYHLTVESDGAGGYAGKFPYHVGPSFRGALIEQPAGGLSACE